MEFSGDEDVFEWLSYCERLCKAQRWSQRQLLRFACTSLAYQAADWCYTLDTTISWAEFKQQACDCFGCYLRQRTDQSVRQYTTCFLRLQQDLRLQCIPQSSSLQLQKYVQGLMPDLRQEVESSQPADLDEAISQALFLEELSVSYAEQYLSDADHRREDCLQPQRHVTEEDWSCAGNGAEEIDFADSRSE